MRFGYRLLAALIMVIILMPAISSIKVSYHDENVQERSSLVLENSSYGTPVDGTYIGGRFTSPFESSFIVPYPDLDNGNGSYVIFDNEGDELTVISMDSGRIDLSNSSIRSAYLDNDQFEDLVVRDLDGNIHVFRGRAEDDLLGSYSLDQDQNTGFTVEGAYCFHDLDGDGIDDMISLPGNGSRLQIRSRIIDGPTAASRTYLPFNCTDMLVADDHDGDLIPDIILYGKVGSNSTILVYSGKDLTLSYLITLPDEPISMTSGDLNGDGKDDITLHIPGSGDHGTIMVVLGGKRSGIFDGEEIAWFIDGAMSRSLKDPVEILNMDLDGDGASDLIIGDPDDLSGRGRISVYYGGGDRDFTIDADYLFPDADMIGNDTSDELGAGIFVSIYDMASTVPGVFLKHGKQLIQWELPEFRELVVQNHRFLEKGQGQVITRAQVGQTIGIWIMASQGSPSRIDTMRVWLETDDIDIRPIATPIVLSETGPGTGVLYGEMVLGDHSIGSRSIIADQNDIISIYANYEELPKKLFVKGKVGVDDPPYFDPEIPLEWTTFEGREFERTIDAFDPDGDTMIWNHSAFPDWLRSDNGTFSGTPGNSHVGNSTFNITISSTIHSVNLTIKLRVINEPPVIIETSVAPMAWEGRLYTSSFDLREDGIDWNVSVFVSRNGTRADDAYQWLNVSKNGTVSGIPRNIHVGNWTANLILDDGNADPSGRIPSTAEYSWNISVLNEVPSLIPPSISRVTEYEATIFDFDSDQEGDVGTVYEVIRTNLDEYEMDPITGRVSFIPIIGNTEGYITVQVKDIWNSMERVTHYFTIENSLPYLTSALPDVFVVGEQYEIDIDSNEEGNGLNYRLNEDFFELSNLYWDGVSEFRDTGRLTIFPWNLYSGEKELILTLEDNIGGTRSYFWNITILPNASFSDPSIGIEVLELSSERLVLDVDLDLSSSDRTPLNIYYTNSSDRYPARSIPILDRDIDNDNGGILELDTSGINGTIWIWISFDVETSDGDYRYLFTGMMIEIPDDTSSGGGRGTGIWFLFLLVLIILILGVLLGMIEKTSFAFQTVIFRGGQPQEEPVISSIQDNPGLRLREIGDEISISRRDLVTTLVKLEDEGHIQSVPDGIYVRFLPTVGSFVDGPLVLNRYQIRIARIVMDRKKISEEDLRLETGLSSKKIDREASLMKLKGALSDRLGSSSREYYMSSKQKQRVRKWVEGER